MCNLVFGKQRARVSNSSVHRLHNHRTPLALSGELKTILICQPSQSFKAALKNKMTSLGQDLLQISELVSPAGLFPES